MVFSVQELAYKPYQWYLGTRIVTLLMYKTRSSSNYNRTCLFFQVNIAYSILTLILNNILGLCYSITINLQVHIIITLILNNILGLCYSIIINLQVHSILTLILNNIEGYVIVLLSIFALLTWHPY